MLDIIFFWGGGRRKGKIFESKQTCAETRLCLKVSFKRNLFPLYPTVLTQVLKRFFKSTKPLFLQAFACAYFDMFWYHWSSGSFHYLMVGVELFWRMSSQMTFSAHPAWPMFVLGAQWTYIAFSIQRQCLQSSRLWQSDLKRFVLSKWIECLFEPFILKSSLTGANLRLMEVFIRRANINNLPLEA